MVHLDARIGPKIGGFVLPGWKGGCPGDGGEGTPMISLAKKTRNWG
jgi:hypothetical protein